MRRIAIRVGLAAAFFIALAGSFIYYRIHTLEITQLSQSLRVVGAGVGGNVAILETDQGAVVVDTLLTASQARRISTHIREVGAAPVAAVINTHYHSDHTHGNPALADGARVIATDQTRRYLERFDAEYWTGARQQAFPNELFSDEHEIVVGGKTIRIYRFGRGHTGGDLVVLFVEDRVLHAGDLFFHRRFPVVDAKAGGSIREWVRTLDRVLALEFDTVIPGHGSVAERGDLVAFRAFLAALWVAAEAAQQQGWTLAETLDRTRLQGIERFERTVMSIITGHDRDYLIERAWEEASVDVH
jgi:glyoxylase-like metal-dependent hydrolase (beta-lactamase superfamily II)